MELDAVKHLLIYHLDNSVSTPIAISPSMLADFRETKRFETSDAQDIQAAYEALAISEPLDEPDGNIDARWGVLFIDADDEVCLAAYTDAFGVQGMIDEDMVCFQYPAFRRWLEARVTV